jgi:hypothetical protein
MNAIAMALLLGLAVGGAIQANGDDAPVKKSKTGICHAPGSTYYNQTKSFTPFKTLDECLKSGGRMPKK